MPNLGGLRLLILIDTYVPARISGALQMHDLAREFAARGQTPTVVVPAFDLEQRWRFDQVEGVRVLRVRAPRTKDVGLIRRALAEAALPLALINGIRASGLVREGWDAVVWYSPSIFLGPAVAWAKRRQKCRSYLILRDLFPDWAVDAGVMQRGVSYHVFKAVERYQYSVADVIGVQTPANEALVRRDCSKRETRIEVLNNWLAEPKRKPTSLQLGSTALAGKTVFVYAGNMGSAQALDCMIELASALQNENAGFLFVGRGSDVARLKGLTTDAGLDNVLFVDEVPGDEIQAILEQCHVGLISLDPRHTTHNIPGKLVTYLYAGLPVLARINAGNDLHGVIERAQVGRVTRGTDFGSLLRQARELLTDPDLRTTMAQSGRRLAVADFSTAAAVEQVLNALGASDMTAGETSELTSAPEAVSKKAGH